MPQGQKVASQPVVPQECLTALRGDTLSRRVGWYGMKKVLQPADSNLESIDKPPTCFGGIRFTPVDVCVDFVGKFWQFSHNLLHPLKFAIEIPMKKM